MPFGLNGAVASFQWVMHKALKGVQDYAVAYIDDILIYSPSWEAHMGPGHSATNRAHCEPKEKQVGAMGSPVPGFQYQTWENMGRSRQGGSTLGGTTPFYQKGLTSIPWPHQLLLMISAWPRPLTDLLIY